MDRRYDTPVYHPEQWQATTKQSIALVIPDA